MITMYYIFGGLLMSSNLFPQAIVAWQPLYVLTSCVSSHHFLIACSPFHLPPSTPSPFSPSPPSFLTLSLPLLSHLHPFPYLPLSKYVFHLVPLFNTTIPLSHLSSITPGRKSGKGCFNYSGRKGKDKTENKEARELLQQFSIPLNGRYVTYREYTT